MSLPDWKLPERLANREMPITREVMESVADLMYVGAGTFASYEEHCTYRDEICALATGEWVEPLFQLLATVEDAVFADVYDSYYYQVLNLLTAAAKNAPDTTLEQALKLAPGETRAIRAGIMSVLQGIGQEQYWPYLAGYLETAGDMSELEAAALLWAIGALGGSEASGRLHKFRDALKPEKIKTFELESDLAYWIRKSSGQTIPE